MKNKIVSVLIALLIISPVIVSAKTYITGYDVNDNYKPVQVEKGVYVRGISLYPQNIGAVVPSVVANFQTSLASKLSSTETSSMTIVSGTTEDGTTLNGVYGFTLDEGTSNKEYIIATCVDTACSSLTRGISYVTGSSSITALKKEHRRGASVKITDHPLLGIMANIFNGRETIPANLYYTTHPSNSSASTTIMDKSYVDDVGAGGFTNSNVATTKGLSAQGTAPETVGVNASSSSGLGFDTDGSLRITASSTGGIKADSNGIYVDGTDSIIFSGNQSFTGNIYSNQVVFSAISSTTITGATSPQPVYLATSTGALNLSSGSSTLSSTYYDFIGFAISSGNNGQNIYVQTSGIVSGFSGLTVGKQYYIGTTTAGTITSVKPTASGDIVIEIGKAISATQLLIQRVKGFSPAISMSDNTTYYAHSDVYVLCKSHDASNYESGIEGYINGASVIRSQSNLSATAKDVYSSISMFVARGSSFKCVAESGDSPTEQYIPYN